MDHIKEFWEKQGRVHEASHCASWGDSYAIELEIETIGRHIRPRDKVLDIGCANGYATFRQHQACPSARFSGVDYANSMIGQAERLRRERGLGDGRVTFSVASATHLPFQSEIFDIAYTTRVLINLPTWYGQQEAILEALRVVKKGGILLLSEGFWEPLCLLNSVRLLFRLPALQEHDFNRYLKKRTLESWLGARGLAFEVEDFSSVYYFGSRLLRDLVEANPATGGDYSSPVNKAFYDLERTYSGGGVGVQQAYVIRK